MDAGPRQGDAAPDRAARLRDRGALPTEQPWPEGPLVRAPLDLFYAHSLVTYAGLLLGDPPARAGRVEAAVDLKAWTCDQIVAEARRRALEVWEHARGARAEPFGGELRYIDQNDYPPGIRGTLRDAVSYLWVELLADTSLWRPEQSNELYRLDLAALLAGDRRRPPRVDLAEPRVHPL